MPKVKRSSEEMKRCAVRQVIRGNQELNAVSDKELAIKARFTPQTLRNKKKAPETITLGELWEMNKILKFTNNQMIQLISGKPVEEETA